MTRLRYIPTMLAAGLAITSLACGQATKTSDTIPQRRILLGDEIRTASAVTAFEAVSRLRPEWLRRRGPVSYRNPEAGDVVVYLNSMRLGESGALRTIPVNSIVQMQFLSGSEATVRFGTGHGGGAILVQTQ